MQALSNLIIFPLMIAYGLILVVVETIAIIVSFMYVGLRSLVSKRYRYQLKKQIDADIAKSQDIHHDV